MFGSDPYENTPERQVMFEFKRYRVTKNNITGVYCLWYGGNILAIDNDREKIMDKFKRIGENFEAIAA